MSNPTYDRLIARIKEVKTLNQISACLAWDQETMMPRKGAEARAEQLSLISALSHDRFVEDENGRLLAELDGPARSGALGEEAAANVREVKRAYDREKKLPTELVAEIAKTQSLAQDAWAQARKKSDFSMFAPWLEKNLGLQKRVAELVGYETEPYDALLDQYEPGARAQDLAPIFDALRKVLVPLVAKIAAAKQPEPIVGHFPKEKQKAFGEQIAREMGFDFEAGRLDVSNHPFCSGFHPRDVRITTRYAEDDFTGSLFGIMHEAGHGLYEQGFDPAHTGTPMAEACSTGVHESQSRMWENMVGRSRAFWQHYYPTLQFFFPEALRGISLDRFVFAVNEVQPSLIRTESDEVTYNLHVALRFEIEQGLFRGTISVNELPGLWNKKMQEYLGVTPPDDAQGVLQDVHWSCGLFGYFPTYTLGNLYAAQLFATAKKEIGDLEGKIGRGELLPLREWLRERVHKQGMRWKPADLVAHVTGEAPTARFFNEYLATKFGGLYGV